jgi:small subunit ribosomal protein S20
MPHTDSAWKRMRQADKRKKRNRVILKAVKEKRKELVEALKGTDAAKKVEEFKTVQQALDRAATKGYIHANKAARLKSRAAKKVRATAAAK